MAVGIPNVSDRWLAGGMLALGAGLAANTLLGPLFLGAVNYPFTETVYNETLGLEAISMVLIAPLAIVAAIITLRGHPAGPVLALGPTGYAAYMLVQYVVGPQYPTYQPSIAVHLGLFVLSGALLWRAWSTVDAAMLPRRSRGWAIAVFLLAAFVVSRVAVRLLGHGVGQSGPGGRPGSHDVLVDLPPRHGRDRACRHRHRHRTRHRDRVGG
jgi:hypothetical protein